MINYRFLENKGSFIKKGDIQPLGEHKAESLLARKLIEKVKPKPTTKKLFTKTTDNSVVKETKGDK